MIWKRKKQEQEGSYMFNGTFYVTSNVKRELSIDEILFIYKDVKEFVKEKRGIDYLQVYEDDEGRKLFFIDQLNREMIKSGDYLHEYNYCTLLFNYEY